MTLFELKKPQINSLKEGFFEQPVKSGFGGYI